MRATIEVRAANAAFIFLYAIINKMYIIIITQSDELLNF